MAKLSIKIGHQNFLGNWIDLVSKVKYSTVLIFKRHFSLSKIGCIFLGFLSTGVHKVCFKKIRSKLSSVLLLCLLRIFMKQKLSENLGKTALLPYHYL